MVREEDEQESPWLIGKVRVRLADGTEELWMTQMRPPSEGPYWTGWLTIPEDAEIVEVAPMLRAVNLFKKVKIDQRTVADASPS